MAETETPVKELSELKLDASNGDASATNDDCPSPTPSSGCNFKDNFKAFSKFGDLKSDGKLITLSQSDKWMKQAKVIDGKKITTTDTGIYFKKLKSQKIGVEDYKKFLDDLAKNKKVDVEEIKSKMTNCGNPGHTGLGVVKAPASVERLTNPKNYTGSSKERFDETGKGKGISGRKDLPDSSGYVTGYQHKDTYNKTH